QRRMGRAKPAYQAEGVTGRLELAVGVIRQKAREVAFGGIDPAWVGGSEQAEHPKESGGVPCGKEGVKTGHPASTRVPYSCPCTRTYTERCGVGAEVSGWSGTRTPTSMGAGGSSRPMGLGYICGPPC